MTWRLAESLKTLRDQINQAAPRRSKISDGTIGDTAHSKRASDHNPVGGVVKALDITHDPLDGCDAGKIVEALRGSKDPRIKYLIFRSRIANFQSTAGTPAWAWRKYNGTNPHDKHFHISVRAEKAFHDNTRQWTVSGVTPAPLVEVPVVTPTIKVPMVGTVKEIQSLLRSNGYNITVDGKYGPKTTAAVKSFQKAQKPPLKADGIVGPLTWAALKGPVAPPVPVTKPPVVPPKPVPVLPLPKRAVEVFAATWGKKERAAGLVGNFQQESYMDLRPDVMGDKLGGDFTAFGIGQHRKDRFLELVRFALTRNQPWTNFETQLAFINQELISTERFAGDLLRRAETLEEATAAGIFYLRPAGIKRPDSTDWPTVIAAAQKGHGWANRLKNAKALM